MLRSKVAVFVDLWSMHTELALRAAEVGRLRRAVDDAVALLDGAGRDRTPDPAAARARRDAVRDAP